MGFSFATGARIRLFYNGKQIAERRVRGKRLFSSPYICVPSGHRLSVGCFDGMAHFKGLIDDVRTYNYELTAPEVEKLYKEGGK